jgi:hypothetical protein
MSRQYTRRPAQTLPLVLLPAATEDLTYRVAQGEEPQIHPSEEPQAHPAGERDGEEQPSVIFPAEASKEQQALLPQKLKSLLPPTPTKQSIFS